ncbi:MAG: glycerol-3-phosphate acyltransferase, partial [Deltaproteobacteria bacterium]|nr:glycerol-3-phosphate acyltransferase [Deltaproteobacteria bacterium]
MNSTVLFVLVLVACYLLAAIPFGLLVTRFAGRGDIREEGSGNIGATNVYRVAGRKLGALTLLLDML